MTGNSKTDHRLETYLTALEKTLRPFPVSDRAEIVTEIKSHILDALERDPQTRLDTVLSALGEPETVANRYLLERGMKPAKPSISPIVKWIVIGFLGTLAMLLVFAGFLVSRFGSIVEVDGKRDHVSILNGLIKVDGEKRMAYIDGDFGGGGANEFDGNVKLTSGQAAQVKFANGKFDIANSKDGTFTWSCKGLGSNAPTQTLEGGVFVLDLSPLLGSKCDLTVPPDVKFSLDGANGKVDFVEPRFPVSAHLANGKVSFRPDAKRLYKYDVGVSAGQSDHFDSSDKPEALAISIHLANGKISRDN
jgi:hypothetical protein